MPDAITTFILPRIALVLARFATFFQAIANSRLHISLLLDATSDLSPTSS